MSQLVIYLSCLLAMVCQVRSVTKTSVCLTERIDLRSEVVMSYRELANIGRKLMPSFYSKGLKCRGYIDRESPFQKDLLKESLRNFVGSKFLQQKYKLFRPFFDAFVATLNGTTAVPSKAPRKQLWNVKTYVTQLVACIYMKTPSVPKLLPVKYDALLHKMDVKKCLINAGIKATPRRVQIVQYNEMFEELYNAVKGFGNIAAIIKFLKLK